MLTPHGRRPRRRREDCVFVIDASAGCSRFPCGILGRLNGLTERGYDFVSVYAVPDKARPLAALGDSNYLVMRQSGGFDLRNSFPTPWGVFLVHFKSDQEQSDQGWIFSWSILPLTKFCTTRSLAGANGAVDDGSGAGDDGLK